MILRRFIVLMLTGTGAAYDTELAFATMFTAEPYLEQHNSAWA